MKIFAFRDVWVFAFLLMLPLMVLLRRFMRRARGASFTFSTNELIGRIKPTMRQRLIGIPFIIRLFAIALILAALARPQTLLQSSKAVSEGIDIVLALDTSTSMLAEDFKIGTRRINRFDIIREVVKDFVHKRKDDRIGMVAFAARAYTVCPLTTDYEWLYQNLDRVKIGMIEDGTAIGSALATSCNRLRNSKTKSRVVILLTDGVNNVGSISALTAAEAARALKIKVYTICIGTKGLVPYPLKDVYGRTVYQNIPIEIDEEMLKKVAEVTGGRYYLASDTETLRRIYDDINRLEKSEIEHFGYREYNELFSLFLIPALFILAFEIVLANTVFLKVP